MTENMLELTGQMVVKMKISMKTIKKENKQDKEEINFKPVGKKCQIVWALLLENRGALSRVTRGPIWSILR